MSPSDNSLNLARWNGADGSSSGWWLVREVPGLCVFYSHIPEFGWCFGPARPGDAFERMYYSTEGSPIIKPVWGKDEDLDQAEIFLAQNPGLKRKGYKTRKAACLAIERTLYRELSAQGSSLSEIIK